MKTCELCNKKTEDLRLIAAGYPGDNELLMRGVCDECHKGFEGVINKFIFDAAHKSGESG